jgi:hypothetical protein
MPASSSSISTQQLRADELLVPVVDQLGHGEGAEEAFRLPSDSSQGAHPAHVTATEPDQ